MIQVIWMTMLKLLVGLAVNILAGYLFAVVATI